MFSCFFDKVGCWFLEKIKSVRRVSDVNENSITLKHLHERRYRCDDLMAFNVVNVVYVNPLNIPITIKSYRYNR